MSFENQYELTSFCKGILNNSRIRNKSVLLCEGSVDYLKQHDFSPRGYRQLEDLPDCSFYRKLFPEMRCFTCGSRKNVLRTYFKLKQLAEQKEVNQYFLNPNKLFAIIDLDIQSEKINDIDETYPFPNTETIFYDLYQQNKLNHENALKHKIFVTGLIHKEAYFIIPELQQVFDKFPTTPTFQNKSLNLQTIYQQMTESLNHDADLKQYFDKAIQRIQYCTTLNTNSIENLQQSILQNLENDQIINALLTIKKSKDYWEKIQPEYTIKDYKGQLLLEIARFYTEQTKNSQLHIPALIGVLKDLS